MSTARQCASLITHKNRFLKLTHPCWPERRLLHVGVWLTLQSLFLVSACSKQPVSNAVVSAAAPPLESMNIQLLDKSVLLTVMSNGCTSPADFAIRKDSDNRCHYTVERLRMDRCRRASFKTQLKIDWNDAACASDEITFINPVMLPVILK